MPVNQTITAIPSAGHRGVDEQDVFVDKQEAFQDALTNVTVGQLNTAFDQLNTLETNVNNQEASAEAHAVAADISEANALEYASGDLTTTGGSAKAWAIDTASPDGTATKSAKTWAGEASTSATNALASENAAELAETNTITLMSQFENNVYVRSATPPSSTEAVWFDTNINTVKIWNSLAWVVAGTSVNGMYERDIYVATAGQTTFASTYDLGSVNVYVNGMLLLPSDYTASNGTSIILNSGVLAGDVVDIMAIGAINMASVYTKAEVDSSLSAKQDTLVSGTNIKTLNGTALIGSGNVAVQPTLESGTNLKTINGASLLGSGNISVGSTPVTSTIGFVIEPHFLKSINIYENNSAVPIAKNLATLQVGNYLYLARSEFLYNSGNEKFIIYKINLTTYQVEASKLYTASSTATNNTVSFKFVHDGTDLYGFALNSQGTNSVVITKFGTDLAVVSSFRSSALIPIFDVLSTVYYDATYWYFVIISNLTYDATVLVRAKRDGTESKHISISHSTASTNGTYIGFAQDTTHFYFSGSTGSNSKIVKVDKATFNVVTSVEFTFGWIVIAVDATYVYVQNIGDFTVSRLNVSTLATVGSTTYTLTPYLYRSAQIGDYVYGAYGILKLSTMELYKITNTNLITNKSQYNGDIQGTYYTDADNIHIALPHINYSNFVFGTSYYSDNLKLSFVNTLCTPSAGTAPVASAVMTVSAQTAGTVTSVDPYSTTELNPMIAPLRYIDQI